MKKFRKIEKVLIANRGEIAIRIIRTLKTMGIKTVAVHSEIDTKAMHVSFADESVCIGPADANESYNDIRNVIAAAMLTNADAIHPGYGFLSESARFAHIVAEHGIIFLGPTSEHLEMFGDKIVAKKIMQEGGLQIIQGLQNSVENVDEAYELVKNMELPLLIKATECGGGRGQRIVYNFENFHRMFLEAQKEAENLSKNRNMYVETFFDAPKHIEMQVLGDGEGNVISLGTRDCSAQRKHQKVLEEGPAAIDPNIEKELTQKVCAILSKYKYRSLGTVEFLEHNGKLFFIEMNPRIQVEHPVTEMITRQDLIELQIKVACNEGIPKQEEIKIIGHAMESRINAENAFTFLPSPGKIEQFLAPGGPNVRIDSALYPGWIIPPNYDSLALKIITYGKTRQECLKRHEQALNELAVSGIETSTQLHLWLIQQKEFIENHISTQWLELALKKEEN